MLIRLIGATGHGACCDELKNANKGGRTMEPCRIPAAVPQSPTSVFGGHLRPIQRFGASLRLWFVPLTYLLAGAAGLFPIPATAATFAVNSTIDDVDAFPGDGICATATGDCTLRAAIQELNAMLLLLLMVSSCPRGSTA